MKTKNYWADHLAIIEKIKSLSGNIKGIYKTVYEQAGEDIHQFAFNIAQQANTSKLTKKGAEATVGTEIVKICLQLYPNVKLGDVYKKPSPAGLHRSITRRTLGTLAKNRKVESMDDLNLDEQIEYAEWQVESAMRSLDILRREKKPLTHSINDWEIINHKEIPDTWTVKGGDEIIYIGFGEEGHKKAKLIAQAPKLISLVFNMQKDYTGLHYQKRLTPIGEEIKQEINEIIRKITE